MVIKYFIHSKATKWPAMCQASSPEWGDTAQNETDKILVSQRLETWSGGWGIGDRAEQDPARWRLGQ